MSRRQGVWLNCGYWLEGEPVKCGCSIEWELHLLYLPLLKASYLGIIHSVFILHCFYIWVSPAKYCQIWKMWWKHRFSNFHLYTVDFISSLRYNQGKMILKYKNFSLWILRPPWGAGEEEKESSEEGRKWVWYRDCVHFGGGKAMVIAPEERNLILWENKQGCFKLNEKKKKTLFIKEKDFYVCNSSLWSVGYMCDSLTAQLILSWRIPW